MTSVPDAFSGLCHKSSHQFHNVGVHYSIRIFLSGSHVAAMFTNGGSTTGVHIITTLWSIPKAGICASSCWSVAYTRDALSGQLQVGKASFYSLSCSPPVPTILWGIQLCSTGSCQSFHLLYTMGRAFSSRFSSTCYHGQFQIYGGH